MMHLRRFIPVVLSVLLIAQAAGLASADRPPAPPVTAILGAFAEETELLERDLAQREEVRHLGLRFVTGELRGRKVVVARSGIGKVNAAMTAALLIQRFRPAELIFTGIAGGINPDLGPGDIVIGEKTVQHDYGAITPRGFQTGKTSSPTRGKENPLLFPAEPRLLTAAEEAVRAVRLTPLEAAGGDRAPRITRGIIETGDVFVASTARKAELRKSLNADAVEMEGAAVAQVCWQLDVPCLVIRSLSDVADDNASRDIRRFTRAAARNSAQLTTEIVARLAPSPTK